MIILLICLQKVKVKKIKEFTVKFTATLAWITRSLMFQLDSV